MTGRIYGVQTRLDQGGRVLFSPHLVWSSPARPRGADGVPSFFSDDMFVKKFTGMIVYLRPQQNLQGDMKKMCPKFLSTRWM